MDESFVGHGILGTCYIKNTPITQKGEPLFLVNRIIYNESIYDCKIPIEANDTLKTMILEKMIPILTNHLECYVDYDEENKTYRIGARLKVID